MYTNDYFYYGKLPHPTVGKRFFPLFFQKIYLVHFHTHAYWGICVHHVF
jgi:hypothetical protein